jgi:hypothetical protein
VVIALSSRPTGGEVVVFVSSESEAASPTTALLETGSSVEVLIPGPALGLSKYMYCNLKHALMLQAYLQKTILAQTLLTQNDKPCPNKAHNFFIIYHNRQYLINHYKCL